MAIFVKEMTGDCEMTTGAYTPTSTVQAFTGENNGMTLEVTFYNDGVLYTIPVDVQVKCHLYYESRKIMTPSVLMDTDGSKASCAIPETFTAVSGNPLLVIRTVDENGKSVVVCAFTVSIKGAVSDDVIYLAPPNPDTVVYLGRAPYIGENGHWYAWNNTSGGFVDTGVIGEGQNGNPGYNHIKYSAAEPTQDEDMTDTPSAWIGIYSGTSETAPTAYTAYTWYLWKGLPGNNGTSSYTHIKWGTSLTPETLLDTPDVCIGITSTNNPVAPTVYTGYSWFEWKGQPGQGSPSDANPAMNGSVAPGTAETYSRADHVHPSDTTKTNLTVVDSGYSAEATYALGTFCTYNSLFYECTTTIAAPEAWTVGHWTQRTIGYVLKTLNDGKANSAQGALADTAIQPATIAMITSGGVFSGGAVTAQGSPNQTVAVEAVSYITDEGKRFSLSAVSALAATAADATNPRIDIVYGSGAGVITYLAGTAAGSPTQPATPAHGVLLSSVTRAANDNTVATSDITKKRKFIATADQFVTWTTSTASSNTHACDCLFLQHIQFAIVNADATSKTLTLSNVPYGRCEVVIEIDATSYAPAFTWTLNSGSTVAWAATPSFVVGKTYVIVLKTKDGGATWDGYASAGVA